LAHAPDTVAAPHLSVIVPAYNEEGRIGSTLEAIEAYLRRQSCASEVLVVDDGSADATSDTARAAWRGDNLRVLRQEPNQGKGAAIRRGMAEARGRWRLFADADNSTPIEELDRFWPAAERGADVVIASRALPGSRLETRQPLYRETMGAASTSWSASSTSAVFTTRSAASNSSRAGPPRRSFRGRKSRDGPSTSSA